MYVVSIADELVFVFIDVPRSKALIKQGSALFSWFKGYGPALSWVSDPVSEPTSRSVPRKLSPSWWITGSGSRELRIGGEVRLSSEA